MNKAVVQVLNNPATAKKLGSLGSYPSPTKPDEFKSFLAAESEKFKNITTIAGIKAQ
nr:hypothetical protein [Microvirga makkahensis]